MQKLADSFEIRVNQDSASFNSESLSIKPVETTDGIPIYNCHLDDKLITQLRQESNGEWVQIWGTLDRESVQEVGKAIEKFIHQRG